MSKTLLLSAAISGFLAVSFGAFGAHALKAQLGADITIYQTAVQYHFYHSLALLAAGLLLLRYPGTRSFQLSGLGFLLGLVIFCGSLYLLAITQTRWLGAITPIGGLLFLLGWAALAIGVYRQASTES